MPRATDKKPPQESNEGERLHKRIAAAGLCSRREAEKWIQDGRVTVNGDLVTELGVKVGPDDEVRVDGRPIQIAKHYYVIMNKPIGYVTTLDDPQGRPTVKNLLPDYGVQLKPVGRLDMDTEGLLLFTNDGDLAQKLTHPSFGIEKEYLAVVEGVPDDKSLERLRKGIYIEGGKTSPAKVEMVSAEEGKKATLRITIHEGRKRQVRLMCEAIGHPVRSLKRVRLGHLVLKHMPAGSCRALGKLDVEKLRKAAKPTR
jgi:23S rRNA pseudouridine2605 synthase